MLEVIQRLLAETKTLIEDNPTLFLLFLVLSVVANFIQIKSYLEQRRRNREEALERERTQQRLAVFEFLFARADSQVKTDAELEAAAKEITERSSEVASLKERIELLRMAGRREVIAQGIERTIGVLRDAHEELKALRADNAAIGELPQIPEEERIAIEAEVTAAARRPFDLPKSLAFRCLLLALFVLLLPYPTDVLITVAFLHVFLRTFFEAAKLSREEGVALWTVRHRKKIGLTSAVGSWFMLLNALNGLLARPFDILPEFVFDRIRRSSDYSNGPVMDFMLGHAYFVGEVLLVAVAVIAGVTHWHAIAPRVLPLVPKAGDDDFQNDNPQVTRST